MLRHNNWMGYSYDGVKYSDKTTPKSVFKIHFEKLNLLNLTYKEALYRNAEIIRDTYSEPFDICLSGGTDSEIIVRVFKDLGIKFNTYTFKFEDDHNIKDVTNAINLCNSLNIKHTIIDFNLKKFFENDAIDYAKKTFCQAAARLPRLKWLEMLDNIPVFGEGEPYWFRIDKDDFSKKSSWGFGMNETGYVTGIYSRKINRTAITEWYEYTPEVLSSFYNIPYVKKLLSDNIYGKLSSWSSRYLIHQDIWSDTKYIAKLVGYEGKNKNPGELPEFMIDFQINFLKEYNNEFTILSEEEFKGIFFHDQRCSESTSI